MKKRQGYNSKNKKVMPYFLLCFERIKHDFQLFIKNLFCFVRQIEFKIGIMIAGQCAVFEN